jgi:uncharacterized protein YndB with AHSA1/START domain
MSANLSSSSELLVRKVMHVDLPQAETYRAFVEHHGKWWPLQRYHIGSQAPETVIIEPHTGGRWFERATDGTECDWGKVKAWEPPHRIVLLWQISADWKFDELLETEVEVRFVSESSKRTRLELEHRLLDQYGDKAMMMKGIFDSDGGWGGILREFERHAHSAHPTG